MRISRLVVSGFRGFATSRTFDLDADAIIIVGVNGQGKTSLFDSILWALTGAIPRLGDDERLVSMYSPSGEARVEVALRSSSGEMMTVTRSFDGEQQQLRLVQGEEVSQDDVARVNLLAALWPDAAHTPDGQSALTSALTRSVYLQQDLVREFIEADDEQQRFSAVSELVGAGRVTDLSLALERAKTAWSRATNVQLKDLETARSRLGSLEARLEALGQPEIDAVDVESAWAEWWDRSAQLVGEPVETPSLGAPGASLMLDARVKEIDARRRSVERQLDLLTELLEELEAESVAEVSEEGLAPLQAAVDNADAQLTSARRALQAAQASAAEQRRLQVQLRDTQAELRALAELALRHLDGPCPVCGQEHDAERTRGRLEGLVGDGADDTGGIPADGGDVAVLAADVERLEQAHLSAVAALRATTAAERERLRIRSERSRRLEELGLPGTSEDIVSAVRDALAGADTLTTELSSLRSRGEKLALDVARAGEGARRDELGQQVDDARARVTELEHLVNSREQTGELAGEVLGGLRDAASEVVAAQLDQIDPLLQRIYATADPHPSFRAVRLLTKVARGRGRLNAAVIDPHAELSSDAPEAVLSSSQLNALAVSVFLALNLGVPTLPMQAVMLDDPLQSLDDVNLLGLIDLLRRTKDQRQLFVSTHDVRFGALLARKLRPIGDGQRTRVIELSAWGPQGPTIRDYDAVRDAELLRIAA